MVDRHDLSTDELSRRRFLATVGATGVISTLAGCTGGGGSGDATTTSGGTTTTSNAETTTSNTETSSIDTGTTGSTTGTTGTDTGMTSSESETAGNDTGATSNDTGATSNDTGATSNDTGIASNGTPSTGTPKDDTLTFAQWDVPKNSQYNPYNPSTTSEARRLIFDRYMKYNLKTGNYDGYAVSDWTIDGQTFTLTPRSELTWHDGSSFGVEDLVVQLKLDMYTGGSLAQYVDEVASDVHKKDDTTAQIDLAQQVNENILLQLVQPKRTNVPAKTFKKYADQFDKASSDDDRTKVQSKLSKMKIKDPVGTGPFQFEDADSQRTLTTKYEKHPEADQINFPKAEWRYLPTNQKRWQALISNTTDGSATLFVPKNVLKKLPDTTEVGKIPRAWGMGLMFQFSKDKYKFSDIRVRQAIAHVIDRKSVAKNSGSGTGTKVAVSIPSGITGSFSGKPKKKLGSDASSFNEYATDTDKATSLLEDAGFSKSGGTWQTPNGEKFAPTLKCPAGFSDFVSGSKTIASQLKRFGIPAKLVTKENSSWFGQDYVNGNWDLAAHGWASYSHSYAWFHMDYLFNSKDSSKYWNVPETVEVPPYAKPDGSRSSYDPAKDLKALGKQNGDKADQLVRKLAWGVNQSLPALPLQEKLAQTFVTTDDWNVPSKDADSLQAYWPTGWLPREGRWTAKTQ